MGRKMVRQSSPSRARREIEAIVFPKPNEVEIRKFELLPCGADEIVVKTLYSLVSTSTELRIWAGHYGADKKFPLIPGYSVVGEVIEAGSNAKGWKKGELISGRNPLPVPGINSYWGAQASYHRYVISGYDCVLKLPENANPFDYLIVEIGGISWRGVKCANVEKGEFALVVGQGLIGALSAKFLMIKGAYTAVMDVVQSRLSRALKLGAIHAVNAREANAYERIRALFPEGADIIIEASGQPEAVQNALQLVRNRNVDWKGKIPRFIFQANYIKPVPANLAGLAPTQKITFLYPGDRTPEDRLQVLDMVARGELKTKDFVGKPIPFREARDAYRALKNEPDKHFTLAFKWA